MDDQCGNRILSAFRFLEDVGLQIEALRRSLRRLTEEWAKRQDDVVLCEFKEGCEYDSSEWLFRSAIDVFAAKKPGRKKPFAYCGFQISLAPPQRSADRGFLPHLVVLLTSALDDEQWSCEDFQLDSEYLASEEEWEDPWIEVEKWSWTDKSKLSRAFAVSLTQLRTEGNLTEYIIMPFAKVLKEIQREMEKHNKLEPA